MKPSQIAALFYVAMVVLSFIKCGSEGYWGVGTSFSLLFTLPWSLLMVVFMWAIAHDGARSLLVFLVPFAAINTILIFTFSNWTKWLDDRSKGSAP